MMKANLFIACICFIVGLVGIGGIFVTKFVIGNRQFVDFNHNFNIAYVSFPDGTFETIQIKAWKDYENSDSIQFIDINGKPYYTHLNRVILTRR